MFDHRPAHQLRCDKALQQVPMCTCKGSVSKSTMRSIVFMMVVANSELTDRQVFPLHLPRDRLFESSLTVHCRMGQGPRRAQSFRLPRRSARPRRRHVRRLINHLVPRLTILVELSHSTYLLGLSRVLLHNRGIVDLPVVLAHVQVLVLVQRVLDHQVIVAQLEILQRCAEYMWLKTVPEHYEPTADP